MILTLEALRAQEGDCLLLHFGTRDAPRLALIDGGPGQTYEDVLLPRLQEIHRKRGTARLDIDLAMVSHIDNDHITGIKKLFRRLQTEIEDDIPDRPFRVRRLWHNTFNDVLDDSIDEYYESFQEHFTASTDGKPDPKLVKALERILAHYDEARDAAEAARDIGGILAGQPDGRQLRDIHAFLFGQGQILALN